MKKQQLSELKEITEKNSVKLEQSEAILDSVRDSFDEVAAATNSKENKEYYTFHEFDRVQKRTEVLLNLLDDFLSESSELNKKILKELMMMKDTEK